MINEERAQRALRAMAAYRGTQQCDLLDDELVTDFLADMHHALHRAGVDDPMTSLDARLWSAHEHFNEEAK